MNNCYKVLSVKFHCTLWVLVFSFVFCANQVKAVSIESIQNPDHIVLQGTIRDFQDTHPDFENDNLNEFSGVNTGSVLATLSEDGKPVLNPDTENNAVHSQESFNQWFRDVPEINQSAPFEIVLKKLPGSADSAPIYSFENDVFFPIDGLLFGNQERIHNYHFTYELHTEFTYTGPQDLRFVSDDDLYVYVNNQLVIDLGGVHARAEQVVNTGDMGLVDGETYPVDLFFAERHTTESFLMMQTGIELKSYVPFVDPAAVRSFSHQYFQPGEEVEVAIDVINSSDYVQNWTVREEMSFTWTANDVSHNGTASGNNIVWQIAAPPGTTRLTYTGIAPTVLNFNAKWSGSIENEIIGGDNRLNVIAPASYPFTSRLDIGKPGLAGGFQQIGDRWAVLGSGQGFGYDADHGHFLFKKMVGDFRFVIRDLSIYANGDHYETKLLSRMGIMARQSLDPASPFVYTNIQSINKNLGLQWRHRHGAMADWEMNVTPVNIFDPRTYLCLQRIGDCFIVSTISALGEEQIFATQSVMMDDPLFVGVAVTSSHTGESVIGSFSHPSFEPVRGRMVYSNAFDTTPGGEWSNPSVDTTPVGDRQFLGQFGNESVQLNLGDLTEHTDLVVCFDLFALRSLDGNNDYEGLGPDFWSLALTNANPLFQTTFSNYYERYQNSYRVEEHGEFRQSFPMNYPSGDFHARRGTRENNSLGYTYNEEPMDSVYRVSQAFAHQQESVSLNFSASGLQGLNDESWGLDNVRVYALQRQIPQVIPTPTETPTETPIETPTETPAAITVELTGLVRDFKDSHPDFESFSGSDTDPEIVKEILNFTKKPIYNSSVQHETVSTKENFDHWFHDTAGVNLATSYTITMKLLPNTSDVVPTSILQSHNRLMCVEEEENKIQSAQIPLIYQYDAREFFPIDDNLYGNEGRDHNYHFTYELHARFTYPGDPAFVTVSSDDDMWVFINNQRVIDLGGAHPELASTIDLSQLGLTKNKTYTIDIFYAERHTNHARYSIVTNLLLEQGFVPPTPTPTAFHNDPTATPTITPRPTKTATPKPTRTPRPTKTPTARPTKTPTPVPSGTFTIGGGKYSILPGKEFEISIPVNNMPSTAAIMFDVQYDKNILTWTKKFSTNNTLLKNWKSVDANEISSGKIRVGAAAFSAKPASGSGDLIVLTFKIASNAKLNNNTKIEPSNLQDGVAKAKKYPITIDIGLKGDVDASGKITARDAQEAFRISVGRINPTAYQEWAAEVTGDNRITAADAQKIFEASIGRVTLNSVSGGKSALSSNPVHIMAAPSGLTVGYVEANPGTEVLVPILLDYQTPITALLLELAYDDSRLEFMRVSIDGTLVEDFGLADGNETESGIVLIGAASFMADPITSSGILINLRFQVKTGVTSEASIEITSSEDDLQDATLTPGGITINSQTGNLPEPYTDEAVFAQGYGGGNLINIRNMDSNSFRPITSVLQAMYGAGNAFRARIGGGDGRATYVSTGDVDGDGGPDLVITMGPVQSSAQFPNIVIVRDAKTRRVIGHSFMAFPTGNDSGVNYNGGEIRTAVGDFLGNGKQQIAAAQGRGGNAIVRFYQYTGLPAPNAFEVAGQVNGLIATAKTSNANGGVTLAAGDLDGDGRDELVVGQTASVSSVSLFHVIDLNEDGSFERRVAGAAFPKKFRGNGGIELTVADLNGDGWQEIVAASQGNPKDFGDERDTVPVNLISVIQPIVTNGQVTGFSRLRAGILNTFSEQTNPSGSLSITAAELDNDPQNGKELIIGTGSMLHYSGYTVTPVLPAPQSKYMTLKVYHNGSAVTGTSIPIGSNRGYNAFVGPADPASGAIYVGAVNTN